MQKLICKLFSVFLCVILLCGCRTATDSSFPTTADENVHITEQEKDLLREMYLNEESIRNGNLKDYQVECLQRLRTAESYLLKKYPGVEFFFTSGVPQSPQQLEAIFYFYAGDKQETTYTVSVRTDGEGYAAADDFYGPQIAPAYDELLRKTLEEAGFTGCTVQTHFPELKGFGVDASLSGEEVFSLRSELGRDTIIYLIGDAEDTTVDLSHGANTMGFLTSD